MQKAVAQIDKYIASQNDTDLIGDSVIEWAILSHD